LVKHDCEPRLQVKLAILVEELVTNSLYHGGKSQDLGLLLVLQSVEDTIKIALEDNGPAFDPLAAPPITGPDPTTGGGIGLAIIHAWGDDAVYSRVSESNILKLTLR